MISTYRWSIALGLFVLGSNAHADGVPSDCTQLVVAVAPSWDSLRGEMQLFERRGAGDKWSRVGSSFPVLFGKNGIAWGTGVAGQNESGLHKKEHDGRA